MGKKKVPEQQFSQNDPSQLILDLNGRIRALENKYNVLTERLLVVNQNMIEEYKQIMKELRNVSNETKQSRIKTEHTQEVVKDVVKEMKIFAKKDQLKVLEKYIDMINILELVTTEQLDKKLERFKSELNPTNKKEVKKVARRNSNEKSD